MQNIAKRVILERCRGIAVLLVGFVLFLGAAERSAPVFAQDGKPELKIIANEGGEEKKGPAGFLDSPIMPLLVVMVLFFFFIILPAQRRQKKEQESIQTSLKKNDEVVTSGGIVGIVSIIKENEDEVVLKIDDNARIRVLKSSIVRIRTKEEPKDGAAGNPPSNTSIKA